MYRAPSQDADQARDGHCTCPVPALMCWHSASTARRTGSDRGSEGQVPGLSVSFGFAARTKTGSQLSTLPAAGSLLAFAGRYPGSPAREVPLAQRLPATRPDRSGSSPQWPEDVPALAWRCRSSPGLVFRLKLTAGLPIILCAGVGTDAPSESSVRQRDAPVSRLTRPKGCSGAPRKGNRIT